MASIRCRLCFLALLLLTCGGIARGGEFSDPSGFSLAYPEGWVAITQSSMGAVKEALPQNLRDWIAKNNVDLSQIVVMLVRNGNEQFLENVNVVVEKQQLPLDDETAKKVADGFEQRYRAMGMGVEKLQGRVQKVGSRDALVIESQSRPPGSAFSLWQKQVLIPGGGNTYIVTCTGRLETFQQHLPAFDGILTSLQAPAPVTRGFDWSQVGKSGIVGGIIGGLIGVFFGISKWLSKKAKRVPHADDA
jgi:hypothetical protein